MNKDSVIQIYDDQLLKLLIEYLDRAGKVYRHLGYRISGEQKWVFFKTH
ncbi:MAG: hypothetical protein NDF54_05485 [archaeon GB-1867-035]|nr:hypothetical protein [Candidatus Culexmicrobium profundum]